ncbi:MAG: acyltransferase [Burkholderiaceae bacterium]
MTGTRDEGRTIDARAAQGAPAKLAYVDQARGIAILLVLLVHANQHVSNLSPVAHALATFGQSGVQLFFVASAFTLCLSYGRSRNGPPALGSFWLKRIFRIAPMYYAGILLYLSAHLLVQWHDHGPTALLAPYTPGNLLANLLMIHGFVPSANNSIVPGGWSIGTEMAFYLCFPLLFHVFQRVRGHGVLWLGWPLLIAACVNVAAQAWLHRGLGIDNDNNTFLFYNLLNQMPVFLIGMLFYFLTEDARRPALRAPRRVLVMGMIAGAASTAALWLSSHDLAFAFVPMALGATFACLLALMRRARQGLDWLAAVGRLSYSIYVVHFVITWITMDLVNRAMTDGTLPEIRWLTGFVFVAGASVVVARWTERAIEKPGIALGARVIDLYRRGAFSVRGTRPAVAR